jgi:hypothetical protein
MACKVLKVEHCGPIEVEGLDEVISGLETINNTLLGEITVAPSDQWEALLTSSVTEALENAEIEVTIGDTVTVEVDTSAGPVEITGTVTVAEPLEVSVSNFPTEIAISNFEDLAGVELTVTLDGETVTVTPDAKFTELFNAVVKAISSTIRVDYESTGMCVFGADGETISPPVKQFDERRYNNTGMFLTSELVLSQFNPDGSVTSYELKKGETVAPCPKSDQQCYLLGTLRKFNPPAAGAEAEHWFTTLSDGSAGNAVPHDDVSVVFANGAHASGQPADVTQTFAASNLNDAIAGAGQGASQTRITFKMYFPADGFIVENNANTGERIVLKMDGAVIGEKSGSDTGNPRGVVDTPLPVCKGEHIFSFEMSDATAFGGMTIRFSEDEASVATAASLPIYNKNAKLFDCIKVEKCQMNFFNAVSGEQIKISDNDVWTDCSSASLLESIIGDAGDCDC